MDTTLTGIAAGLGIRTTEAQESFVNLYELSGSRSGCTVGPPDLVGDKILEEVTDLPDRIHLQLQGAPNNQLEATIDELRAGAFALERSSGATLREYQKRNGNNPRIFPPHSKSWTISHRFQEAILALGASSGFPEHDLKINEEIRTMLHNHIEEFVTQNPFADPHLDITRSRVAGYYCGYFGICPELG